MVSEGIIWKLNHPSAPHFGRLWKAKIKSVKHDLRRTMQISLFTLEQFSILLSQTEACLNSRPLYLLPYNPNDLQS